MEDKLGKAKDEYRQERYLQHATHGELTQRLDDIFVNFFYFAPDGQPIVRAPLESNPFAALFLHVLEELTMRGGKDYSFPVQNFHLDNAKYPNVSRASQLFANKKVRPASYLLKFGRTEFLEPMLKRGAIRISPASFYQED